MIYLYGLIEMDGMPAEAEISALPQALGSVFAVRIAGWTMLCSTFDGDEVMPKRRLMLAHTQILERMMTYGPLLPARFGLLADDMPAVADLITARKDRIAAEFDRVRGCVEVGVRITFARDSALRATLDGDPALQRQRDQLMARGPEAHFDKAEFGRRLAEALDRRRGNAQRALIAVLMHHCKAHVLRKPEADVEVLRAEFLLDAATQAGFANQVERAAATLDFAPGTEPLIQIVGPVPMYHFVQLALTTPAQEEAA